MGSSDAQFNWPAACKGSWGASLLWQLTGDPRYEAFAYRMGDWYVDRQEPDGWWHPLVEHTLGDVIEITPRVRDAPRHAHRRAGVAHSAISEHLRGLTGGRQVARCGARPGPTAPPGPVGPSGPGRAVRRCPRVDDVPGRRPDGSPAVLKVHFPNRDNEHEAAALRHWNGDGAVRLLDEEPDLGALLLERCVPGTPMSDATPDEALDAFVDLLPRLWKPASAPFRTLADEAAHLAVGLVRDWERTGRPFERRLVDVSLDAFASLAPTQGEQVLLHQDLHGDNVLRAAREPWLVIDPKPLVGEREFAVAPIVRSTRSSATVATRSCARFDRLTADLGLDRERARRWTIAQTVARGSRTAVSSARTSKSPAGCSRHRRDAAGSGVLLPC